MSNDAQEALRRIFIERAKTMQDPFNDYTHYISEQMMQALDEAEGISVNESGYVVTDLVDENVKLRRQVAAARKVVDELKGMKGAEWVGRWLWDELDRA